MNVPQWRPFVYVGQSVPRPLVTANEAAREEVVSFDLAGIREALARVTPTLLIVGIATGAAFAIGSGLVSRLIFRSR